jgi:hypothetical protein
MQKNWGMVAQRGRALVNKHKPLNSIPRTTKKKKKKEEEEEEIDYKNIRGALYFYFNSLLFYFPILHFSLGVKYGCE